MTIALVGLPPVFLFLLQAEVALIEAPPDRCEIAPLRTLPPTEEEWRLILFDSERIRILEAGSRERIWIDHPVWTAEGIRGPSPDRRQTGRTGQAVDRPGLDGWRVRSDTLLVPWNAIEEIEKQTGNRATLGMGIGGAASFAGVLFLGGLICAEGGCEWRVESLLIAVPVGVALGWVIGRNIPFFATVYCARADPR